MANRLNIEIAQGASFLKRVEYLDDDEQPIDLSGCTARLMVRQAYTDAEPLVAIDTEDNANLQGFITLTAASGQLDIEIYDEHTASLEAPLVGVWDLELEFSDGKVERILEGKVAITPEVTK